jgi:formylglycine-generating enzyme required for sulfatase activity
VKKVFFSSTSTDLADYRRAAIDTCMKLGFHPIVMEHFEAMGVGATEGSKRKLSEADVYVGIFAHRYGYIESGYDRSVTEIEFDYAGERGLDRLCFLIDPTFPWPHDTTDYEHHDKLAAFKDRIDRTLIRAQFTTVDNFTAQLMHALIKWREEQTTAAQPAADDKRPHMARIFVSYSRKNEDFARRLAGDLDRLGADVWIDVDDIPAGMKWSTAIQQGLDACEVMIVIISPESMASTNVEDEWQYFLDQRKPVIPVLWEPAKVHFQLKRIQYVDFHTQDYDSAFARLRSELRRQEVRFDPQMVDDSAVPLPAQKPLPERAVRFPRAVWATGAVVGLLIVAAIILITRGVFGGDGETLGAEARARTMTAQRDQTSTAAVWTDTPTNTPQTPTKTPTRTPTPTLTFTPSPTGIPAGSRNRAWTPVSREFDGVPMVLVPAGCFMMGDNQNDDALPVHEVCFEESFWMDRTEVSNGQFAALGGRAAYPGTWTHDDYPRENVSWDEAQAYCEKRGARLPTEAEWEYAARGPEGWNYPWGDEFVAQNVVFQGNSSGEPAPTGAQRAGASWVGALELSGNVSEWTADWYAAYSAGKQTNPTGPENGEFRTIRGGSFLNDSTSLRATFRFKDYAAGREDLVGFRCAHSS